MNLCDGRFLCRFVVLVCGLLAFHASDIEAPQGMTTGGERSKAFTTSATCETGLSERTSQSS